MKKQLLVTGGAGFIGSNFIEFMINKGAYHITNIDSLSYAGKIENTTFFSSSPDYRFIQCDIRNRNQLNEVFDRRYDVIVHFAAESHVDRSISEPNIFIETNVFGTYHLLETVREGKAKRMVQVSTDEVYGSLKVTDFPFTEHSPIIPNNPYAASKASSDLLVRSYFKTFQTPVIITRCSNNYGPRQDKEKFIPKVIMNALDNKEIPIYGDGKQVRDWLFVEDHCRALQVILEHGEDGEVYNIGGSNERANIDIAKQIISYLGKGSSLITHIDDRKGHDRRYAINWGKVHSQFGWEPKISFTEGLIQTIESYKKANS
ncbi:dTDP-glucose 4,6-dehydratase [Bacillus sp. FJAT-45350]|uniref:dTDP-glucose 4,6-dehydratase n=1 Tax=Bacillus sp. FJAT-45350 TaxID=2011014 RepID=UPI000BB6BCEC|nr:dTDP-glucose 4,6-dehydratase [Bacillus sp. FJAT-45350]